jgi:hypothetical protein
MRDKVVFPGAAVPREKGNVFHVGVEQANAEPLLPFVVNPDSAVEIEADVRARCKPGAAKTLKRIVSRSCSVLGSPLRFIARN